ncbi:MAG: hypothetical protein ACO3CV_03750 [Steroidobacteraceae bacterium]
MNFARTLPLLLTLLAMIPAQANEAVSAGLGLSHEGFCAEVQRRLVDTRLPINNVIEPDYEAFKKSKAAASPLRTHQFLTRSGAGEIVQISCKTKSADHLRAVHGAQLARDPTLPLRSCRDIQRDVVMEVWRDLDATRREGVLHPPSRLMLDADAVRYTGSSWVESPSAAYSGNDGRLHLRATALFAAWEDWRWKIMPKSFRGNHYCHLVAPEQVRRLMLGEATPAASAP